MKKIVLFSVLFVCSFISVYAQLRVDSLGKVAVGGLTTLTSKMYLKSTLPTGMSVDVDRRTANDTLSNLYHYGIIVGLQPKSNFALGIKSRVHLTSTDTPTPYAGGVLGDAYAGSLCNYGIMGYANPLKPGAGVFGSAYYTWAVPDQLYAGLFWGPTKVIGELTVSGTINGIVLGPSATPNMRLSVSSPLPTSQSICSLLNGLATNTFYLEKSKDQSMEIVNTSLFDHDDIDLASQKDFNLKEKQVYSKQHYGLSADQLEEVFPDLVYEDENGNKSINYVEMVPVLVQAINELSAKVAALEGGTNAKRAKKAATAISDSKSDITLLSLGQNKPNPFGTTTTIDVSVPETVQTAFIYVYDLQGKKVDQIDITARGKQSIQLTTANLTDGMYLYSLIADGKVVETRRMIVEK